MEKTKKVLKRSPLNNQSKMMKRLFVLFALNHFPIVHQKKFGPNVQSASYGPMNSLGTPCGVPTKHDILNIFKASTEQYIKKVLDMEPPEPPVKKVIPRLKQLVYGEVLTTEEVLNRMRNVEKQRKGKGSKTGKGGKFKKLEKLVLSDKENDGNNINKRKDIEIKLLRAKKSKRDTYSSSSNSSSEELSYDETDDSPFEEEEDPLGAEDLYTADKSNLKKGSFALVCFKGGKRMTVTYKYLCVIEDVDWEEGEIKVTSLKCADDTCRVFSLVESDVSFVIVDHIIGITPEPSI
ncbi:unnamed protein product [Ceutorhynchus assimilis]|uniref:Uncharacterized protein n=1 Tax=Ceutorhynchus assimilis TaxID=467358 RepID=A0A9N9N300_9CUCU|nr:unnamed protein product [Ceutorhynchus assimilis]